MKKNARAVMKKHYILFLITCILLGFMGIEYNYSFNSAKTESSDVQSDSGLTGVVSKIQSLIHNQGEDSTDPASSTEQTSGEQTSGEQISGEQTSGNATSKVQSSENSNSSKDIATTVGYGQGIVDVLEKNISAKENPNPLENKILGTSRGVFASLVNGYSQGKIYVKLFEAFFTLFAEPSVALLLMILVSVLFSIGIWVFFSNMLRIVSRRVFLEAKLYSKVPYNRFLYFFAIRRWIHTAINLMVWQIMEGLWYLTIIGGFIKHYSYAMVPYILCEYPDMKAREAITLSRKMMNGHKLEMFKLDLSFIGWIFLSGITFGLSGIFYSNPYQAAAEVEFYAEIRRQAKEKNIPGTELLQDRYLFELADEETLAREYSDAVNLYSQPRVESDYLKGFKALLAKATSVVLFIDKDVRAVEEIRNEKNHLRHEKDCVLGEAYPGRLSPIPKSQHRKWVHSINYNRYYTVWNLILMFISFCFIGWCWEVSLHIIQEGTFVNRGMLHGPWIPIYGSGGILILIALTKLRKYPMAEFFAAIVLAGILEYMTSLFVELSKGKRWWDYTGYFLNLNGRICAEGLLVFGIMGMIIVYTVAPLLDHYLRMIPHKVVVPLSIVLMAFFGADCVYSHYYPNEGKGITDYAKNDEIGMEQKG